MVGGMTAKELRDKLVGRRIKRVLVRPFRDGLGGWAHDPVLVLDNGSRVYFSVQETNMGEYGVSIAVAESTDQKPAANVLKTQTKPMPPRPYYTIEAMYAIEAVEQSNWTVVGETVLRATALDLARDLAKDVGGNHYVYLHTRNNQRKHVFTARPVKKEEK